MTLDHPGVLARRALAGAASGLILAGILLPGAALAAPGGPPVAGDDVINTVMDTVATGNVLDNDKNNGGGTLTVTFVASVPSSVGTLVIETDGDYTFTPAAGYVGTAGTSYNVSNDTKTRTALITINVASINGGPTAVDDDLVVTEDVPADVTADLLANDTDPDTDVLGVTAVANAAGASVDLVGGVVTVATPADTCGADIASFDYTIADGNGGTDTGHASVDATCANDAPVTVADVVSGTEDTHLVVDAADLVLNDSDVDLDVLVVDSVLDLSGGTVTLDAGTITFVPAGNLCGVAAGGFTYTADDGHGGSTQGAVQVDLGCVNDAPSAVGNVVTATEDVDLEIPAADLTADDTDVDGDELTVSGVSNATGGTVESDGTTVTFTPAVNQCGAGLGGFDYELSDGATGTATGSVVVNVTCVNDDPTATDDELTGTEDTNVVLDAADLATNDADVDMDSLMVTGVSQTVGGTIALDEGTITFIPDANSCGSAAAGFDYVVSDGEGGTDTGHVTIELTCANDAPVAVADVASVASASGPADHDVTANDTDADGDQLSLTAATVDATKGTATVESGLLRFTPVASFTGEATIGYTVTDGVASVAGTLTVTVGADVTAPTVAAPTVAFGVGRVNESAPLKISWSATDASSGIAGYEVQASVAGGAWTAVYSGAGTTATKFYAFSKSLVWRVRATDKAGNRSAWTSSATRKLVAYQNGSTSLSRRGTWTRVLSSGSSGTGYATTRGIGNRLGVSFTGRAVIFVAPRATTFGYVKVYVDGQLLGRYSLSKAWTVLGVIVARKAWSASGAHSIRVVSDSTTKRVSMDAFVVLR